MKRSKALAISKYFEKRSTPHTIKYTPSYGFTVRIPEEQMTDTFKHEVSRRFGKKPVHGVEYR